MAPLWVDHRVLVLRGDQKVFDGFATLEVSLDAISTTDPFDTFTKTLCVGYDNVTLTLHSIRCIHKELIPVSIKLKSTLDTPKARQIIRKAEKDLLQTRLKVSTIS